MKTATYISMCTIFCIVTVVQAADQGMNLGNVTGGNFNKAHAIINKRCTTCHSKEKIDMALSSGKNMNEIQKKMEKRGAKLSSNECEVLGIFWKQSQPVSKK